MRSWSASLREPAEAQDESAMMKLLPSHRGLPDKSQIITFARTAVDQATS